MIYFVEDTVSWLNDQKDQTVSITLDIGTCNGMTLLTVLFICGSDVRLANVLLTDSKKGDKLAELCFKALTMKNKIDGETLKRNICGVVGDGAFIRKNEPFKKRLREVLDHNELTFRWDLLHLCNRSHISARGSTKYEVKKASKKKANAFEETDDNDLIESTITTEIGELIDFIQLEAKKYRTGIRYTELHMNAINFKRPKIWSTTRMCLYEFEMTLRFLENKVYFEIPRDKVILCQMYCMVMFGFKIILKQC